MFGTQSLCHHDNVVQVVPLFVELGTGIAFAGLQVECSAFDDKLFGGLFQTLGEGFEFENELNGRREQDCNTGLHCDKFFDG